MYEFGSKNVREKNNNKNRLKPCLSLLPFLLLFNSGVSYAGVINHSGQILVDETWSAADSHIIQADVSVQPNVTLTIEAGAQVGIDSTKSLKVDGGTLLVQGTAEAPVVFDSNVASGVYGNWQGIQVNSGSATIEQARITSFNGQGISFAANTTGQVKDSVISSWYSFSDTSAEGDSCIRLTNSSPTIQGNTLTGCNSGLEIIGAAAPLVNGNNVITQNNYGISLSTQRDANNKLEMPQPIVNRNQIFDNNWLNFDLEWGFWDKYLYLDARENWWGTASVNGIKDKILNAYASSGDGVSFPYVDFSGFLDAPEGVSALAGNTLFGYIKDATLLAGETYTLLGTVQLEGTLTIEEGVLIQVPDGSIILVDGLYGVGNLLVQGTAESPVVFKELVEVGGRSWGGILFKYGGSATIEQARISGFSDRGISLDYNSSVLLTNSVIDGAHSNGNSNSCVYFYRGSATLQGNTITNCQYGLYLAGSSSVIVNQNNLITQNTYGVYLYPYASGYAAPNLVINQNQITDNSSYNYYLSSSWTSISGYQDIVFNAQENWWGSSDVNAIRATIYDSEDNSSVSTVDSSRYLLAPAGSTDSTPPEITSVSQADEIRSGVIQVQAQDNIGIDRVEFVLDGMALISTTTGTTYSARLDFSQMSKGAHTLSYTVYDGSGNSTAGSIALNIDFQAPAAPVIIQPVNNSITGTAAVSVSGRAETQSLMLIGVDGNAATAPLSVGVAGQETQVEIYLDNVLVGSAVSVNTSGNFNQSINLTQAQGVITARTLSRGGYSPLSQPVTVNLDQTGPAISAVTYAGQALDSSTITQSGTVVASVQDPNGISRLEFVLDATSSVVDTNGADGYSLPLIITDLALGVHSLVISAYDSYDNLTQLTVPFSVAAVPPPAPVITSPTSGLVINQTSVTVKGTTEPYADITLSVNNVVAGQPVTADVNGQFQSSVSIAEGVNTITATASDRGGMSQSSAPITVTVDTTIPVAPNLTVSVDQGGEITLNWNAVISDPAIAGYRVYRANSSFTDPAMAVEINSGLVTQATFTDLPSFDGEYYYRVLAENTLGTQGALSNMVLGAVDSTAPRALSIEYLSAGQVDIASGRMAPGLVQLKLLVSEPLLTTPFLSITPQAGIPISVNLAKTSDTEYTGSFEILESTPTGTAYAVFSARDQLGNRGTAIDVGGSIEIDTDGPVINNIVITPTNPVQNDSANPVTVNVQIDLDDAVQNGTQPELSYTLSSTATTPTSIDNLASITPQQWTGSFTLPTDAGLSAPENLQFSFSASDDLNNISHKIIADNSFQVYQGDLPPLVYPSGLQAKALSGGAVQLSWNAVDDASDYQLYRQAPGETSLVTLQRTGNVLEYIDQTGDTGLYRYTIASVRAVNAQESVSAQSPVVEVNSDASVPDAPQSLQLELVSLGIKADWKVTSVEPGVTYSLYRSSATDIVSVEGLTPVLERITSLAIIDPSPSQDEHTYVVTAKDSAGNESAPSASAYLNFGLLPVASFSVTQDQDQAPMLSWVHSAPASIAGYNLFVGELNALTALNTTPLSENSYIDNGFNGDERRYTIVAIDNNKVNSLERSLLLPKLSATLADNGGLQRGVMNRLSYVVTNEGSQVIDNIHLQATIGAHTNPSQSFSLQPAESKTAEVILGGYQDLEGLSSLQTALIVSPNPGEEAKIIRHQDVLVSDSALAVSIATRDFIRGGTGQAQVTVENTSDVEIEIETASSNGNQPSADIRFKLIDADGNVLSTQSFSQYLSGKVITLANGKTVARIPAGGNFISDWFDLTVPSSSPDNIEVRLEVDQLHYHLGGTDSESINVGLLSSQDVSLIETSYFGELTNLSPANSFGDQDIVITGRAVNRLSTSAEFNVPLKLIIAANGFERIVDLQTDIEGNFSYSFTPLPQESGIYNVSVIHPDILERPQQGQFTISRLMVSPTQASLNIPRNLNHPGLFYVTAGKGTTATNVRLEFNAADQPGGALPAGISVTLPQPVDLTSAQRLGLEVKIGGDVSAADQGSLVLTLKSDETLDTALGKITVNYRFSEAQPFLGFSPTHLQTGVVYDDSVIESLMLENKGLTPLENLSLKVLTKSGTPAPVWVSLLTPADLGTLAVGDQRQVQISAAPNDTVAEGVHDFKLRASSANFNTTDIPFSITVTQNGIGNALIKVSDIYTATFDGAGQLIEGVDNARIKLINDKVITIERNLTTDSTGEAFFTDVPAGLYRYRISADNHQDKTGQIQIKPGVTVAEDAFLDYNLITVQWSVNEITIQDKYEITLQATFKTDVPAAVVVGNPPSITLPVMQPGDVFYGEFTLTNHGLIRADNLDVKLPKNDQFFRYELMAGLPDSLDAKQVLTVPYRVVMLQSLFPDGTTSGGGCSSYSNCGSSDYSYDCANGSTSNGSAPNCFTHSSGGSSCAGGGGGTSGGSGGGGFSSYGSYGTTDAAPDEGGMSNCRPAADGRQCGGGGKG